MKNIILLFLVALSFISFAQRPIPMNEIYPKLDSIEAEAGWMYRYLKSEELALRNYTGSQYTPIKDSSILTYEIFDTDTIKTLIIDKSNDLIFELKSFKIANGVDTFLTKEKKGLTRLEDSLISIKWTLLKQLHKNNEVKFPSGILKFSYLLRPFKQGYKFYATTAPTQDSIYPMGSSYLFISNKAGLVIENEIFYHRPQYIKLDTNIGRLIVSTDRDEPFIFARDICMFNLTKEFTILNEMEILVRRNNRTFFYNSNKHEIIVK